jgi:creatinine amidohydrolase/Fe(II)-dependent formamide hydrolase-like protein
MRLGQLTGPEWEQVPSSTVLLPLGTVENHGPHLPMETDLLIAEAVCGAACDYDESLVVAPSIPYGVSYQHRSCAGGSVSLPTSLLADVIMTVVEGVLGSDRRLAVLVVNGHAGNASSVMASTDEIGRRLGQVRFAACSWWQLVMDMIEESGRSDGGGIGHAGDIETSVMLAVRPALVRRDLVPEGTTGWPDTVLRDRRVDRWLDFEPYIKDGVLGSPRNADEEFGRKLLHAAGERLAGVAARLRSSE